MAPNTKRLPLSRSQVPGEENALAQKPLADSGIRANLAIFLSVSGVGETEREKRIEKVQMTSLDGRHCVLKGGLVRGSWNHSDSTERNVKKGIGEKNCAITCEEARGIARMAPRHLTNCTRAVVACLDKRCAPDNFLLLLGEWVNACEFIDQE